MFFVQRCDTDPEIPLLDVMNCEIALVTQKLDDN